MVLLLVRYPCVMNYMSDDLAVIKTDVATTCAAAVTERKSNCGSTLDILFFLEISVSEEFIEINSFPKVMYTPRKSWPTDDNKWAWAILVSCS